jgi:hypothetical protein
VLLLHGLESTSQRGRRDVRAAVYVFRSENVRSLQDAEAS